jgi:hypothetical protein
MPARYAGWTPNNVELLCVVADYHGVRYADLSTPDLMLRYSLHPHLHISIQRCVRQVPAETSAFNCGTRDNWIYAQSRLSRICRISFDARRIMCTKCTFMTASLHRRCNPFVPLVSGVFIQTPVGTCSCFTTAEPQPRSTHLKINDEA